MVGIDTKAELSESERCELLVLRGEVVRLKRLMAEVHEVIDEVLEEECSCTVRELVAACRGGVVAAQWGSAVLDGRSL